ncbi:serine/threonine-protein kinase [Actinomadura namibiensis]|uniref:non-specific serine/threonine protein kinase n=1 Tax=Actinomadura namibiensis TaxID=182080 RepID=A0A7W3QJB8_ACTNM|nr:serine/threonine-protein kinase [Actinomadura namibiensis]MBA8949211.1 serine/threonine-protein kinase [Actinomadura namibiensis]
MWRVPGYTELRTLGEGAQGRVVLARHDATGRTAAIKYLTERLNGDAAFRDRFREEARLLQRLRDPYVAGLYGLVETPEGAAIVMEAVDGVALRRVLEEHGALAPEAALTVLKGSLLGLAAAHDLGIVHRDYKPANVIVRGDGLSKLIDFGIAVDAGEAGRSGTPVYMAPEQWRSEPASPATDVYAATCVFFECVTGRRPFAADSPAVLMNHHLTAPVPVEALPGPLRPLVGRGLAKDPWDRPHGARAFVAELESVAAAAYGSDWEARGVRTLAGAAAALAALFPLTALGLGAAGAGAGAGTSGAGTSGAVAAGAGKGVLGVVGTKAGAAVAGGVIAATAAGGAAVYVAADGGPRRPPVAPLSVQLASYQQGAQGSAPLSTAGQLVQVRGGDPALARRINESLRAPLEERRRYYERSLAAQPGARPSVSRVKAAVRTGGPRYLSVRYDVTLDSPTLSHPTWSSPLAVTVDLKTGQAVPVTRILTPAAFEAEGLGTLATRLKNGADVNSCLRTTLPRLTRRAFEPPQPAVHVVLQRGGLEFLVNMTALGETTACGKADVVLPYTGLTGLVDPEVVKAVS